MIIPIYKKGGRNRVFKKVGTMDHEIRNSRNAK